MFYLLLRLLVPLAAAMLLAACGDLPEPFLGNPGATARRLAVPLTPMLAVPPPSNALLNPEANRDFADLLALDLQKEDVPTLARTPHKTDWRLAVSAGRNGDQVVPRYAILDPSGREQGAIEGSALPAAGWTAGAPWTLGQAARDAVPKILALMMSIRATRDRANPNSLLNRPAVLFVPAVTGAPGDGDTALTRMIRTRLAEFGPLVQVTPEGADFTVTGQVIVTPLPKGQQQVEIAWTVIRPSGAMVGKVSQLNAVPTGSLDQLWGDVAAVVAQEASTGINTVVERFIGRDGPTSGNVPADGTTANDLAKPEGTAPAAPTQPERTVPPTGSGVGPAAPTKPGGTVPAPGTNPAANEPIARVKPEGSLSAAGAKPVATEPNPRDKPAVTPSAKWKSVGSAPSAGAKPVAAAPHSRDKPAVAPSTRAASEVGISAANPVTTEPHSRATPAATSSHQPARPEGAATAPAEPAAR